MRRILELLQKIELHPRTAAAEIDTFVRDHTFPIVDGVTATFFYWDHHPTESVFLLHWVFGLESRQEFQRIPGTDAFYLPIELPATARVEYKLEVRREAGISWMRDPLNPRQAFDPFGSNSVCPMPGYHDPAWVRPDPKARRGHMERLTVRSEAWGDDRPIDLYLPAEYKPHKRYPLLVCHDGDDYRKYAGMRKVLDNLIHKHEVAPLIVAFTSGSMRRNEEYGANPRQARFLVEELLPAVAARYPVMDDPEHRGVMGASFGAVSSLFTAWTYPGVFGRLLLQSGSFAFTDIGRHDRGPLWDPVVAFVNAFRADPARIDFQRGDDGGNRHTRVFLGCGTFESLIYYNRSLLPVLRDAGLAVRYVESQDGHNWINWRDRLRDGLTWSFPGHLWMYYE
jgi:enterochelin esterase-like enzyme